MSPIYLLLKGEGKYGVTMTQSEAREKVQQLVEKFRREQAAGVISQYNESETKTGFIEPLLQALGWNTQDRNEVGLEEKISRGPKAMNWTDSSARSKKPTARLMNGCTSCTG
jgi:hypothetical protein